MNIATEGGEELTMVEVKGDQANGALTGRDAEDARALPMFLALSLDPEK